MERLKTEILDSKHRNKQLEDENNKLSSQLFLIQQFQQPNQNNAESYNSNQETQPQGNGRDDYIPFSGDSPVLIADDD
jgi:hypothetical protein